MFSGSPSASCQPLFTLLLTLKEASLPGHGHIVVHRAPCSLASLVPVLRRTLTPSGGRRHRDLTELRSPLQPPPRLHLWQLAGWGSGFGGGHRILRAWRALSRGSPGCQDRGCAAPSKHQRPKHSLGLASLHMENQGGLRSASIILSGALKEEVRCVS